MCTPYRDSVFSSLRCHCPNSQTKKNSECQRKKCARSNKVSDVAHRSVLGLPERGALWKGQSLIGVVRTDGDQRSVASGVVRLGSRRGAGLPERAASRDDEALILSEGARSDEVGDRKRRSHGAHAE
jgi:hypothetical protein